MFKTKAELEDAQTQLGKAVRDLTGRLKVIVFIHCICSTAQAAFASMYDDFDKHLPHSCVLFDYDFNDPMPRNAARLSTQLEEFASDCEVTLICHSMGGLVARLSVLSGEGRAVRRLFLLGTPNFGALRTAQLGMLSQLALASFGLLYGVFRKAGVRDLTRVSELFSEPIKNGSEYADGVEYVTIPGAFFHEARRVWEIGDWGEWQLWTTGFAALNLGSEFLSAVMPLWKVGLEKPHDGIVEGRSNSLFPTVGGRKSDKSAGINNPALYGRSYLHVEHNAAEDLTHVGIQKNLEIINLVRSIIRSPTLTDWYSRLDRKAMRPLTTVVFP